MMNWRRLATPVLLLAMVTGCAHTSAYRGGFGRELPESIASLEEMSLGGAKQWVLMRGRNTSNPVMLYLHGGPGGAEMSMVRRYFEPLESDFTVVTYDMRGAGKSYSDSLPRESLNLDQYVADAHDLVLKLRERFNTPKIYLVANSWGTIPGALLAQRYPELFHAYVGVSQWTDGVERERASYHAVLDWARRSGNKDAIRELEEIGPPPFAGPKAMDKVGIQKNWLLKSGGVLHGKSDMGLMLDALIWSSEYSLFEKLNFMKGLMASMEAVWPQSMQVDLTKQVPALQLPVYFVSGRHDTNIPLSHVERYFQVLKAPRKELIVFENSAHVPQYEEPDRFVQLMRERVRR